MDKDAVDITERSEKGKNMQLFRVPPYLPLLVLTCWAVLQGVSGSCSAVGDCNSGTCDTGTSICDCAGTGYDGDNCETDINECTATDASSHDCHEHADCTNTPGSFTCKCKSGYVGDGKTCTDINECEATGVDIHECDTNAACTNTPPGSYTCTCNEGFAGNGKTCIEGVCSDGGNECDNGGTCVTSTTPTTCTCAEGYTGHTCQNDGDTVKISTFLMTLTFLTFFIIL